MTGTHAPLAERLNRLSEPYIEGSCRLWLGSCTPHGYGRIRHQGRTILVHRATWVCERGPIPEGLGVLHSCDNPPCRNINHLFLGTDADNAADREAKGRGISFQGEAHGMAKLTEADVLEIRAIPRNVPNAVVAAMYGVSYGSASMVRAGKTWTHL